jgi:serine phosphatase RsbU (regulator of sigma subunit)/anti-sigma regulatory factor (Ser/Thr protein kinase)
VAAENSAVLSGASARTVTLGIDSAGLIVHHDRNAADVLADRHDALLGTKLADLITGPGDPGEVLHGLIEVTRSDRASTTVLAIRTANRSVVEAVVTVEPLRSADSGPLAQVIMRIPPPPAERFIDPALMRTALLEGAVRRIGGALDFDQMAPELVNILVPHFCNSAGLMLLESVVGDAEHPDEVTDGTYLVRRLAVQHDDEEPGWEAAFPVGEILRYPPGSPYAQCLQTRRAVSVVMTAEAAADLAQAWVRTPVARLISGGSMLMLPLLAGDNLLGFFVCTRRVGFRRFDAYDTELGMEFASRTALFMDSARRYSIERTTALHLQRSLLPSELSHPACVEVDKVYLPGSKLFDVGGDWYESIALPGGRVALVVGDVAGHGVRAAVTMGRLRTAIKTLAMLELSPAETLQRLDDLMHELGESEPHFATCVYAIYDTVDGTCELASAGHLPPLLVRPDGSSEFIGLSIAPPLGIGASPIGSRTLPIEDGSLLIMYTDGLVEKRTEDIDQGQARLQSTFGPGSSEQPLRKLCDAAMEDLFDDPRRDDIALLIARLRRTSQERYCSWNLAPKLTAARRARTLIRRPLRQWGLTELLPVAELVVSELVTNAVRYAQSKIGLRLVLEGGLFCEVLDDSAALPRLRQAGEDDERGRGLQVVSQLAERWGARRTGPGKVVWCELALPSALRDEASESPARGSEPAAQAEPGDKARDSSSSQAPASDSSSGNPPGKAGGKGARAASGRGAKAREHPATTVPA